MANEGIAFSLSGLEDLEAEARNYQKQFEDCNLELNNLIDETGSYWVTDELGNYERFKEIFTGNDGPKLKDGSSLMNDFCDLLKTVREIYRDTGTKINNQLSNM